MAESIIFFFGGRGRTERSIIAGVIGLLFEIGISKNNLIFDMVSYCNELVIDD